MVIATGSREVRNRGLGKSPQGGESGAVRSAPNPQGAEGEPERLLLLQTLFAAKQHALRRYQL